MKQDEIKFEISESCSGGLKCSLESKGWLNQRSFSLSIKKGPIFVFLEKLVPDCVCLFHIGCAADNRPPSFEHKIKYGDIRQEFLIFSYERILSDDSFWKHDWFRDSKGNRDLDATAKALSDPKEYYEKITFSWNGNDDKYEDLGRTISLRLYLENNKLFSISGLDEIQEDLFKDKIKKFKGSLLDLNDGPLKSEKDRFISACSGDLPEIFQENGVNVYYFIKEIYNLFQLSVPQCGEKMKAREPLSICR